MFTCASVCKVFATGAHIRRTHNNVKSRIKFFNLLVIRFGLVIIIRILQLLN